MMLLSPFDDLLMSAIAEWCVCWHFTIAQFVVTWLGNVETNWTASCKDPLALTITERINLWVSTSTPVVRLSSIQIYMCRENTSICRHAWWSIFAFFIRSWFCQIYNLLMRKVSNIIHRLRSPLNFSRFKNHWFWCHNISFMCLHFAKDRTVMNDFVLNFSYLTLT